MEQSTSTFVHAGFGLRLGAFAIDFIIFMMGITVLAILLKSVGLSLVPSFEGMSFDEMMTAYSNDTGRLRAYNYTLTGLHILYYSYFESQHKMATPGKQFTGIIVIQHTGKGLTLFQAVMRNTGKILSQMILFIGYFMCIFTKNKQCLHDLFANSYVIRKPKV
jgi:uncharacterized RDD family membrane protein YckC